MESRDIRVLLHDIRSAHNVGSIFRTADAIGVTRIYCSGYTPTPLDRFRRPVGEIAKTALGAEKDIPWEYVEDVTNLLLHTKEEGFQIIAIEQDKRSADYRIVAPRGKVLVLVGNEVDGLSADLRMLSDILVEIPMHGKKESLNVSVAFGVAMFRLFDTE
jgi:tRNA G18 (ribose-2'-O)-methylase SpoU